LGCKSHNGIKIKNIHIALNIQSIKTTLSRLNLMMKKIINKFFDLCTITTYFGKFSRAPPV